MHMTVDALVIDTPDPDLLATFYEDLLGFVRTFEDDGEVLISATDGSGFPMLFVESTDDKATKNRLHLDLRPDDQTAAVAHALDLGARHTDVGQDEDPDVTWIVLVDPDGNEFCILAAQSDAADPDILIATVDAVPVDPRTGAPREDHDGLDPEDEDEDTDDYDDEE